MRNIDVGFVTLAGFEDTLPMAAASFAKHQQLSNAPLMSRKGGRVNSKSCLPFQLLDYLERNLNILWKLNKRFKITTLGYAWKGGQFSLAEMVYCETFEALSLSTISELV